MIKYFKYLSFQWQAKNLHAIHSPFLFLLIKDAVYKNALPKKPQLEINKNDLLLLSILYYLQIETVFLFQGDKSFDQLLSKYQVFQPSTKIVHPNEVKINLNPIGVYILNELSSIGQGLAFLKKIHREESYFVIIPHLRASKGQMDFLKSIPLKEKGCVILEFYPFALLIFRQECSSEYFKIRKWGSFR